MFIKLIYYFCDMKIKKHLVEFRLVQTFVINVSTASDW